MKNIIIIPGKYKPPHKGHLSLIEKLINKKSTSKIIVIISNKPIPLDNNFTYMDQKPVELLKKSLIKYYPKKEVLINSMTKIELIKLINKYILNKKLPSISPEESLTIWNIYINYLQRKYGIRSMNQYVHIVISKNNNIVIETHKQVIQAFKEKPDSVILMKSAKNIHNTRFKFLENVFGKYVKTMLFPNIKDIDSTKMRACLLNNDKKGFMNFLPTDLEIMYKNKIWKILNI
jgi:nicotinamide mononucleotide adenylyltransferase